MTRPRSILIALVASVAFSALGAAPALAGAVQIFPSIKGSGTLSVNGPSAPVCVASATNGTISGCNTLGYGDTVYLVAFPPEKGDWVFAGWEQCQEPSGQVCIMRATAAPLVQLLARPVFVDNTAPSLGTPTVTYSTTTERTATVSWSSEPLSKAECRLDGAAAAPCSGLTSHTMTLPEGGHTLSVRGTDIAGNAGSFTADVSVRIIETALVSGPADVSNEKSPTFTFFTANGSTFDCSVDNVVLAACGSKDPSNNRASKQFSNLAEGKHTFRVRARNGGDIDATTLVRTWTVDTVAPTATLSTATGPGEGALQAVNREPFTFSADEDATFQCRLDSAEFAACASGIVLENLAPGAHRFEVRAVDAAGNVGAVAARNWAVAAATAAPLVITQTQVVERLLFTVGFFATAKAKTTKFASLQVKNIVKGSTVTVTCKGKGCPAGLKGKGYTKKNASGTVSLGQFIKKPLKAGIKITITVSKAGAISTKKVLTVRAGKRPIVS